MKKKNIAVLIEVDSSDTKIGAVNDVLDLARYSRGLNINFSLCGPINSQLETFARNLNMKVIKTKSCMISKKSIIPYLFNTIRWCYIIRRICPDVIHLNYVGWGPSLGLAAYLNKIPLVARAGGGDDPRNPSNKWISRYIANCEAQAKNLLCNAQLQSRVVIAGDLINLERLENNSYPHPLLPPKQFGVPRILFLGQLVHRKGLDVLIKALSGIDKEYDVLLVGGDWQKSGYPQEIKQMVHDFNMTSKVHFINHRTDGIAILKTCDVFVLPSRSEARPRSIIEAMLLNRCIISTVTGGIPSLIDDGTTGLLAPPDDAQILQKILNKVIVSKQLRNRLGQAAGQIARKEFSPYRTAQRYYNTYQELLTTT